VTDRNRADPDLVKYVLRAQKGDERAISILVEQSQDRLMRFCMYLLGNEELAKDLCQETFIRAMEYLPSLKDPAAYTSWLLKMAKNLFLNQVKSQKSSESVPLEEVPDLSLLAELPDQDVVLHIQNALAQLAPEERLLILLVDMEEHTYLEAAEIIGISESDVRNQLHRIRRIFAKKIV
jgi:RNA polymerase sigma-70 factor (ECF subfamily)